MLREKPPLWSTDPQALGHLWRPWDALQVAVGQILPVRTQIQVPFLGSTAKPAENPVSEPTLLSPNHAASPEGTVLGQVMLWI